MRCTAASQWLRWNKPTCCVGLFKNTVFGDEGIVAPVYAADAHQQKRITSSTGVRRSILLPLTENQCAL